MTNTRPQLTFLVSEYICFNVVLTFNQCSDMSSHTVFYKLLCAMVLEYKYYLLTVLTSSKKVKLRISSEKSRQTYCPFVPIHVGEKCIHVWRLFAFTKPTFSMQNPPFQCKTHLFNAKSTSWLN